MILTCQRHGTTYEFVMGRPGCPGCERDEAVIEQAALSERMAAIAERLVEMGKCTQTYREFRFVIEDELTQAYVLIEAQGDCPIGVQGWHHKTFPGSKSVADILNGVASGEIEAFVLWPQNAPAK